MKTTIELSDALFLSAKNLAHQRKTTLRAIVEEGLQRVVADSATGAKPAFKLGDASVRGKHMLIPDPRRWQELEETHVIERITRPHR